MVTMTLKNVPESLYERLKVAASQHRRSLNNEAIVCLEKSLLEQGKVDPCALIARARQIRSRLDGIYVTDADLKLAREEGRP